MNQIQQQIIEIGRKIYEKGFIVAAEGNISHRLADDRILTTRRGVCKGELTPTDLVVVDLEGNPVEEGPLPSTEIGLHLEVYRNRPDIQAVLHAHPPYVISLTLAGFSLDQPYLPESALVLGRVPTAPYGRPSTQQVAESIRPFIRKTDVILLQRHGSLTVGKTLSEAFYKLEILEHTAKVVWLARQLRHFLPLDRIEVQELMKLRETVYGLTYPIIPFQ
ncbi:MAG: class II aldolase/adducin family protein [Calditrichia bacterium]